MAVNNTDVLGFSFSYDNLPLALLEYSVINTIATSVVPVPIAGALVAAATLLFGLLPGLALNVVTTVLGAYVGLLLTRSYARPCFIRCLGPKYEPRWRALDKAIAADGPMLALLLRLTPVAPTVITNILLSLTSLSHAHYVWTTAVGTIPSNLPYAYAAELGASLAHEFPPKDPVMLTISIIGLVASVLMAIKVARIANQALSKHGLGDSGDSSTRAATAAGTDPPMARVVSDLGRASELEMADNASVPKGAKPSRLGRGRHGFDRLQDGNDESVDLAPRRAVDQRGPLSDPAAFDMES